MKHANEALDAATGGRLLVLMQACAAGCADAEAFRSLLQRHLQPLVPHSHAVALLAHLSPSMLFVERMVVYRASGAPALAVPWELPLRERPALSAWLATREPLVLEHGRLEQAVWSTAGMARGAEGCVRIAMHGHIDISARMATHFCLAGVDADSPIETIRHRLLLAAPHLHAAFMSIPSSASGAPADVALTPLQRDLLHWLAAGHSNAEIAAIRGRSPATVRNQLHALYRKIGVGSRAEAAAFASRLPRSGTDGHSARHGTIVP